MLIYLFSLISCLMIISAISIIVAKNPIHSVLYLILVFVGASGLLILLKVEFLGMIFLIIYIGAISVLFLFIIMMLNIRMIELKENIIKYVPITLLIGILLFSELFYLFSNFDFNFNLSLPLGLNNDNVTFSLSQNLNSYYLDFFSILYQQSKNPNNLELLAYLVYTYYVDFFIICGFILFAAMIGSILLTLNLEYNYRKQDLYLQINRNLNKTLKSVRLK